MHIRGIKWQLLACKQGEEIYLPVKLRIMRAMQQPNDHKRH
ncbi:hypothetical protein [Oceanisphaera pacifica]|nr:hypothetical protein [Oceanisphaera pacifica]